MGKEEERLNLVQKLAKIRALSDVVVKNKKGFNYTYADLTEILASITAGMKKYGVSLIPNIVPDSARVSQNVIVNTKFDKSGKTYDQTVTEMLFTADMVYTWINDDDPEERIEVPWFATGSMSDPSQSLGGALTYTNRQFFTSYFQIAQTDNDVDAYRSKQKEAEVSEDKTIAEEIIKQFDTALKTYLADHPEKSDEVKKFASRYVKDAKYQNIKEPKLAAKLLEDFTNTFLND